MLLNDLLALHKHWVMRSLGRLNQKLFVIQSNAMKFHWNVNTWSKSANCSSSTNRNLNAVTPELIWWCQNIQKHALKTGISFWSIRKQRNNVAASNRISMNRTQTTQTTKAALITFKFKTNIEMMANRLICDIVSVTKIYTSKGSVCVRVSETVQQCNGFWINLMGPRRIHHPTFAVYRRRIQKAKKFLRIFKIWRHKNKLRLILFTLFDSFCLFCALPEEKYCPDENIKIVCLCALFVLLRSWGM